MPVGQMGDAVSTQLGSAVELDNTRGDEAGVVFAKVIYLDRDRRFNLALMDDKASTIWFGGNAMEISPSTTLDVVWYRFHLQQKDNCRTRYRPVVRKGLCIKQGRRLFPSQ